MQFAQHQAAAEASDEGYYGFIMTLDVYGLALSPEQYSLASVWLIHDGDGAAANYNAIQIGWEAAPSVYGDSRTRLAATWTVSDRPESSSLCCVEFE